MFLLIAQWNEMLILFLFIKNTTQVISISTKKLYFRYIGPGMYNWEVGFESTKKKNESLMYTILQKLQQSKAPFNSQVDRFNFPV
jgi:hypothetical protein